MVGDGRVENETEDGTADGVAVVHQNENVSVNTSLVSMWLSAYAVRSVTRKRVA